VRNWKLLLLWSATLITTSTLYAATTPTDSIQPRITASVNDSDRVILAGNTHPAAKSTNDMGEVPSTLQLEHMQLLLKSSDSQEKELNAYIEGLNDKHSDHYHSWLTPSEFASRYGVANKDVDKVTGWLELHGLKVNSVSANRRTIDFSGTEASIRDAFHSEIHYYKVKDVTHIANATDPTIPAALEPVVVGVVSLHDFFPRTANQAKPAFTFPSSGVNTEAVTPGDLATIYNLNPLFSGGVTGKGQVIAILQDSDVFSTDDISTFRSTFGLSKFTSGRFSQVHPAPASGANNCIDPGATGDDGEATLDVEYASAAAPNAIVEIASCQNSSTTFGGLIALQNLIERSSTLPSVASLSFQACEAEIGAASNAAFKSAFQQAASEGVSVFVSSGDAAGATCDLGSSSATHGIGVNGFASTPFNVAVGGTDFGDTLANDVDTFWSTQNSSTFESAKSYVPEVPWNDSCASQLFSTFEGFSVPFGSNGFCNSSVGEGFLSIVGGGGGPSGCATGQPSIAGVVSGSCRGYAKPSWQSVLGIPSDGVRDIPDVSLFAGNGVFSHLYIFCFSDTSHGGTPCVGNPSGWTGEGGTSFSSPIMAGIQSLVDEVRGLQGNPDAVYYEIARSEYGAKGSPACNSSLGNKVNSSCVFYDVTQGDTSVNCTGTNNCFLPSGTNGILSISDINDQPAFKAVTGWDFATGIGSVNALNLVLSNAW
jgi:subtilase family serine protease